MKQIGNFLRSNGSAIAISSATVLASVAAIEFKPQIVSVMAAQGASLTTSLIASNVLVPFLPALIISLSNNNLRKNIISLGVTVSVFAAGLLHMTSMAFSDKENKDISKMWTRKGEDLTTEAVLRRESVATKFLPAMAVGFVFLLAYNALKSFGKSSVPVAQNHLSAKAGGGTPSKESASASASASAPAPAPAPAPASASASASASAVPGSEWVSGRRSTSRTRFRPNADGDSSPALSPTPQVAGSASGRVLRNRNADSSADVSQLNHVETAVGRRRKGSIVLSH